MSFFQIVIITFRDIGHNNTDEENYGIEPMVTKNKGDDEKRNSQEDCDRCDQMNKVSNLLCNGGIARLQARCQTFEKKQNLMGKKIKPKLKVQTLPAIRPMTVLSPILTTMPRAVPSTALVEKKAKFLKDVKCAQIGHFSAQERYILSL